MNCLNEKISFLEPKGEKDIYSDIYKSNVIQKDYIQCEIYSIGYSNLMLNDIKKENLKSNSIYGFGNYSIEGAHEWEPYSLLKEVLHYGKLLFNLCEKNISKMEPRSFFSFNDEISLINLIKTIDISKILQILIKWCKRNGFPTNPKKFILNAENHDLQLEYYELDYSNIIEIVLKFICIYSFETILESMQYMTTIGSFSDLENLSFKKYSEIEQCFEFINKYCKYASITEYEFNTTFFNQPTEKKKMLLNILLKNITCILNTYSAHFTSYSDIYFSYNQNENRIFSQCKYRNIFDICWEILIKNYTHDFDFTHKCLYCNEIIDISKKYCENHEKEAKKNAPKNTHNSKKDIINELLYLYNLHSDLFNKECTDQLLKYQELLQDGHSKALEESSKKEIDKFRKKIISLIKDNPL